MTAPPSHTAGPNLPRTARVRLEHEEFAPMTEEQREVLEARSAHDTSSFLADPEERKAHLMEVRKEQEAAMRYDRSHPGAGLSGQGQQEINSKQSLMSNDRPGGKGPHYKNWNAETR